MQLLLSHELPEKLVLPKSCNHILQSIIYRNMEDIKGYSDFIHDDGFTFGSRQFRMFTFGQLSGKYELTKDSIIFRDKVSLEIRSPEAMLLRMLADSFTENGIRYLSQHYDNVDVTLMDKTVETGGQLRVRMLTPLTAYETDLETGRTGFYSPWDEQFAESINRNFQRKYFAYTGVPAKEAVGMLPAKVTEKDKRVIRYKGIYYTGWTGEYVLVGQRKYLDFLYQTGVGAKNAQGMGMVEMIGTESNISKADI